MFHLIAQAAPVTAPITGDGLVGGGIVATAFGLYLVWERLSKRQTEARREELADQETQLKLDAMARAAMAKAHEEERAAWQAADAARKAARDVEVAAINAQLQAMRADQAADRERLAELESREQRCQSECATLRAQNATQARRITELEEQIVDLKRRLKEAGSLPDGTDHHSPLK